MFTYQDKEMFLNELVAFAQNTECIAGLCQTGSGAGKNGYRDLFSHISASLLSSLIMMICRQPKLCSLVF